MNPSLKIGNNGAEGGTRTRTGLPPLDPETIFDHIDKGNDCKSFRLKTFF